MASPEDILKKFWGHSAFRPLQREIIDSVLAKNDVLALLPTGGGKSICFQVPGLILEGLTLVVSPLIALMKDQVENLNQKGIKAMAITSAMSQSEIEIAFSNCKYGGYKFLYVSPERLKTDSFKKKAADMNISLIAVDEAHCISQWGYDFRPSYLKIAELKEMLPEVPIIALTASATNEVIKDIVTKLHFTKPLLFKKSFFRPNLHYVIRETENKEEQLIHICKTLKGSMVVYVRNRKKTKEYATILNEGGLSATYYHAGLSPEERNKKQNDWIKGSVKIIVATNAFGMGIDKADVRSVIHMDLPDSVEAYYQEAGRAGRDEKNAYPVILTNPSDLIELEKRFEQAFPLLEDIKKTYQAICNYFQVAVSAGQGVTFDFNMDEFSLAYKLHPIVIYNSIKFLEREGYLGYVDSSYEASRIKIKVPMSEIYDFEIRNKAYEPLIKLILRSYGGIMEQYVHINEVFLASKINIGYDVLVKMLQKLQDLDFVDYIPKTTLPKLIFTENRVDTKSLYLSQENYSHIKERARARMKAIQDYVTNKTSCRSRIILNYFDEESFDDCGVCDICMENKKKVKLKELGEIKDNIKGILLQGEKNMEEIVSSLYRFKKGLVVEGINEMIDDGWLLMDEQKQIKIK